MNVGISSFQSMVTISYEEHVVKKIRNEKLRLQLTLKLIVFLCPTFILKDSNSVIILIINHNDWTS